MPVSTYSHSDLSRIHRDVIKRAKQSGEVLAEPSYSLRVSDRGVTLVSVYRVRVGEQLERREHTTAL